MKQKTRCILFLAVFLLGMIAPTAVNAKKYYNPNKIAKKVPKRIRKTFIKSGGEIYKVKRIPNYPRASARCEATTIWPEGSKTFRRNHSRPS